MISIDNIDRYQLIVSIDSIKRYYQYRSIDLLPIMLSYARIEPGTVFKVLQPVALPRSQDSLRIAQWKIWVPAKSTYV